MTYVRDVRSNLGSRCEWDKGDQGTKHEVLVDSERNIPEIWICWNCGRPDKVDAKATESDL